MIIAIATTNNWQERVKTTSKYNTNYHMLGQTKTTGWPQEFYQVWTDNGVIRRFIVYRNFLDTCWLIGLGIITLFARININLNKHDEILMAGFVSINQVQYSLINWHKNNQISTELYHSNQLTAGNCLILTPIKIKNTKLKTKRNLSW